MKVLPSPGPGLIRKMTIVCGAEERGYCAPGHRRDRYSSKQSYETLNRIYYLLRLYVNFFQPAMKLVSKTRHGAKVHRVYDTALTPISVY